jgi:hypothetical protein
VCRSDRAVRRTVTRVERLDQRMAAVGPRHREAGDLWYER